MLKPVSAHVRMLGTTLLMLRLVAPVSAQSSEHPQANRTGGTLPPRVGHGMIYDLVRNQTVLFGGALLGSADRSPDGTTWLLNGLTATQLGTAGPAARHSFGFAYDEGRQVALLFGGDGTDGVLGDTWEWNGEHWRQRSASGPPARGHTALTYDATRQSIVLFGGGNASGLLGDTWEYDGASWSQLRGPGPGARLRPALAYDARAGGVLLFGGMTDGGRFMDDLWLLKNGAWTKLATPDAPPARFAAAFAYQPGVGAVLFGGAAALNDPLDPRTWVWNGERWQVLASAGPPPHSGGALVYDRVRNALLLVGAAQESDGTWRSLLYYLQREGWHPVAQ